MKLTANFATCEKNSKLQAGFRCWILSRAIGGPAESRLAAAQVVLTPFSSPAFSLSHTLSLSCAQSSYFLSPCPLFVLHGDDCQDDGIFAGLLFLFLNVQSCAG